MSLARLSAPVSLVLALLLPALPAHAAEHVQASLVAERTALVPGTTTLVGVRFDIEPGWHLYAKARNDTGYPISVVPELPAGYGADAVQWPAPTRHVSPGDLLDHVYEKQVLLLLPLRVPADARPGTEVTLRSHLAWLVCREACVSGKVDVTLTLPVVESPAQTRASADQPLFEATRARLPVALPAQAPEGATAQLAPPLSVVLSGDTLTLRAPGAAGLTFVPAEDCTELPHLLAEGERDGEALVLGLSPERPPNARFLGTVEVRSGKAGHGEDNPAHIFWLDLAAPPIRPALESSHPSLVPSGEKP